MTEHFYAMQNFLLIHGGSHGAWCWKSCITALEVADHRATAIDLPGHGLDKTPRDSVTTRSYVEAVCEQLKQYRGPPLTLVGHSLAGVILPEIICRHPEKVAEVVFLAAIVLEVGECALDYIPPDRQPSYFERAAASGDNTFLIDYEVARHIFFSDLPESAARRHYQQLTPQPLTIYLERAEIAPAAIACPKRYIVCRDDQALSYEACLGFGERLGGPIVQIASGHDAMLSEPEDLAQLLTHKAG